MLERSLRAKGARPTHTLEELRTLSTLLGERMMLFLAGVEEEPAGACLVLAAGRSAGLAFYICDEPDYRPLRPTEAVIHAAAVSLREAGFRHLDLGTISIEGEINWGLVRFKSKFGAYPELRERYVLSLKGDGNDS
jgi:lipid II:glycine glycyltransferase (peptidoglycan interpeptide bridge formation enzyme)